MDELRGWAAADRAFGAYELMVAGKCPFTVQELEPSRKAKRGLQARSRDFSLRRSSDGGKEPMKTPSTRLVTWLTIPSRRS